MASLKFEDVCPARFLMTIDGPISAGKTTFGKALTQRSPDHVSFYAESGHDDHIIDIFLQDTKKYAATFQMLMHGICYGHHELAVAKLESSTEDRQVCVIDRSLIGNMVFAVTNYRLGNIDEGDYKMYKRQNEEFRKNIRRYADVNVYLWVKPRVCAKRNKIRNSTGGDDDTLEAETYDDSYFWEVEKSAFAALLSDLTVGRGRRPLIVDWHDNAEEVLRNFDRILHGYLQSGDAHATSITLSYDLPFPDVEYTHIFDYHELRSVGEFYSVSVIKEVMSALAHTTVYESARNVHIRLPECVGEESFSDLFTIRIQ